MLETNSDFLRSIKYFYTVRDSVNNYAYNLRYLHSRMTLLPYDESKNFYKNHTGFKTTESLKNQNKDYALYNLTRCFVDSSMISIKTNTGKDFQGCNTICFMFSSKTGLANFMKDFRFSHDEVAYGFFIKGFNKKYPNTFAYGIQVCIKTTHKNQINYLLKQYNNFFNSTNRYNIAAAKASVVIPSSIHDRWFDPFKLKVIWSAKEILQVDKEHSRSKNLELKDLYCKLNPFVKQYKTHYKQSKYSRPNNFISNKDNVELDLCKSNTFIVNHYLMHKNPYKRAQARKDWKFAAEEFLNEFLGKYMYKQNNVNKLIDEERLKEEFDQRSTEKRNLDEIIAYKDKYQKDVDLYKYKLEHVEDIVRENYRKSRDEHRNRYAEQIKSGEVYDLDDEPNQNYLDRHIAEHRNEFQNKLKEAEFRLSCSDQNIEIQKNTYNKLLDNHIQSIKSSIMNNLDSYLNIQFSKAEIRSFLSSLNIKTKIDYNKFKKTMIDVLLELNFIENKDSFNYKPKITCRTYFVKKDFVEKFYEKIKDRLRFCFNIIFNNLYYYIIMLKNQKWDNKVRTLMLNNYRQLKVIYRGPPTGSFIKQ